MLLLLCVGLLLLMAAVTNSAGFSPGRHQREGRWETGNTGQHGFAGKGKYGARSTGCGSGRRRGDGKASSKVLGAGGGGCEMRDKSDVTGSLWTATISMQ